MITTTKYSDERFNQLADKLSKFYKHKAVAKPLTISEKCNNYNKIEKKIDTLENSVYKTLKDYELKYHLLKEDVHYLIRLIQNQKEKKEEITSLLKHEVFKLEGKIKKLIDNEKELFLKNMQANYEKIEKNIDEIYLEYNQDKKELHMLLKEVQEVIEVLYS